MKWREWKFCRLRKEKRIVSELGASALWPFPEVGDQNWVGRRKKRMNKYLKASAKFHSIRLSFPPHSLSGRTMKTNDKKRPQMTRQWQKKMERNKNKQTILSWDSSLLSAWYIVVYKMYFLSFPGLGPHLGWALGGSSASTWSAFDLYLFIYLLFIFSRLRQDGGGGTNHFH